MVLAKEALLDPIDIHELKRRGPKSATSRCGSSSSRRSMRSASARRAGRLSTVLDVKILDYPTHAVSKPVAMIPNCAATRHAHFVLDGSGAAKLEPPDFERWPDVAWAPARRRGASTSTR
jgi:fumarate hydratase class I